MVSSEVNAPHKHGPLPFWLASSLPYDNLKIFPNLFVCSFKSYKYDIYDKATYSVFPTARSSRQTWSAGYSLSTANFWLLSRSSITNRMLITVFDTYLNPSSPGTCNHNILRLFNILPNFRNFQILPNFTKHGLYIRVASRVAERLKN